jgi:hypothetical protein
MCFCELLYGSIYNTSTFESLNPRHKSARCGALRCNRATDRRGTERTWRALKCDAGGPCQGVRGADWTKRRVCLVFRLASVVGLLDDDGRDGQSAAEGQRLEEGRSGGAVEERADGEAGGRAGEGLRVAYCLLVCCATSIRNSALTP